MDTFLFRDLDGEFRTSDNHLVKQLSLDTAWVVPDLRDLLVLCDDLIVQVTEPDETTAQLHYHLELKPFDGIELHKLLQPEGVLGLWPVLILALQLAKHLEQLHESNVPQLVIHPQRIAEYNNVFTLLPSPAGVLASFPKLIETGQWQWLAYVAPEVIRTRGLDTGLLQPGDVYALGKTLYAVIMGKDPAYQSNRPYDALAAWVEQADDAPPIELPASLQNVGALLTRMCAFLPHQRPGIGEVIKALQDMLDSTVSPRDYLEALLDSHAIARLNDAVIELEPLVGSPVAGISTAEWQYYKAETILGGDSPDIGKAIAHLEFARELEPQRIRFWCRLGDAYQQRTTHKEHLKQSSEAYLEAIRLSGWGMRSVSKWMKVIIRFYPQMLIHKTNQMPWEKRFPEVFVMRARTFLSIGQIADAWRETVLFFESYHYDEQVYETANQIAQQIEPVYMLRMRADYQAEHQGKDWPAGALSVMWSRNGNRSLSADELRQAQLNQQQNPRSTPTQDVTDCKDKDLLWHF